MCKNYKKDLRQLDMNFFWLKNNSMLFKQNLKHKIFQKVTISQLFQEVQIWFNKPQVEETK